MSDSEITAWLVEGKAISASFLALQLQCDIDTARNTLAKYIKANADIKSKYVLSGTKKSTTTTLFLLVDDDNVDAAKDSFEGNTCFIQIYSLHKVHSPCSNQHLLMETLHQTSDYLIDKTKEFTQFRFSIKQADLNIKPLGQRVGSTELFRLEGNKGPSYLSSTPASGGNNKQKAKETSVSSFFGQTPKGSSVPSKPPLGKSGNSSTNGSKPIKISSPVNPLKQAPRGNDGSQSESEVLPIAEVFSKDTEEDDEEWDGGYKTDKSKLRKRNKVIDDEDDEDDEVLETTLTKEDEKLIAKQTGVAKHGAMDDFVTEVAPVVSDGSKRKKKKLVEKTFVDAKGYMVTEQVMEEVTDDEPSPKKAAISSIKQQTSNSVPKQNSVPSVKAKKGAVATGPPQKNMMAFFSKKA